MKEIIRTILAEWSGRELPEVVDRSVDLVDYISMEPRKIIVNEEMVVSAERGGRFCAYGILTPHTSHLTNTIYVPKPKTRYSDKNERM